LEAISKGNQKQNRPDPDSHSENREQRSGCPGFEHSGGKFYQIVVFQEFIFTNY
jgi:hypothetical protein